MKRIAYFSVAAVLAYTMGGWYPAMAQETEPTAPEMVPLWPEGAPGAQGDSPADCPAVAFYPAPADTANGAAIVVCPGGGYSGLAMDHEGWQIAAWLNAEGVAAVLLRYRVAPYRHPIPLGDAQRAIRTARANADEWKIDPHRIGILGFSAGGHLASSAGTHFDAGDPSSPDPIQRESCRPDFMVLVYPVITFKPPYAHIGSRNNLLGPDPAAELVTLLSNNEQVSPETPPAFLIHTSGDTGVKSENSVLFYLAMRKANVPAELHVFEPGQHGFGLAPGDPVLSKWPTLCINWLRQRGLLD